MNKDDPQNGHHPVSGNRVFDINVSGDSYFFYTRGSDRLTGYRYALVGLVTKAARGETLQFTAGDNFGKVCKQK